MVHFRVANLKKSYKITRTEEQAVLKGINAEFNRGEFVAVLGESGCGKSTFLNIIAGLDYNYTGSMVLKGEFMKDFDEHQMDDYRKKEVGVIFQNYNLINHMTVLENIMIAMSMSDISDADAKTRALELLEKVNLSGHEKKYPHQLSGGQKQRVAIARALSNDPTMILADEPTGNLDKEAAQEIIDILKDIAVSGKIVICVTHSEKVASACNRIIKIDDGVIVFDEAKKTYQTSKVDKAKQIKPKNFKTKAAIKLSVRNVLQNIKRNTLVTIALSIGIAAFVLMFSLSSGIKTFISEEVGNTVNKYQIDVAANANSTGPFSKTDITTIKGLEGVSKVVESSSANLSATYYSYPNTYTFLSITTTFDGFTTELSYGALPEGDNEILISTSVALKLISAQAFENLIGQTLNITIEKSAGFKIAGITSDTSAYDTGYLSMKGLGSLYTSGSAPVNKLYVLASDISYISALVTDINYLGFYASRQDTTVEDMLSYVDIGTVLLAGIASISLIVAAIMIFIVMYTSVIERTKEIGILRAIGARRTDIRKIFIFEACILGLAAGIAGSLISLLIGTIVNLTLASSFATNVVNNSPLFLLIGVVISVAVSILSSLGPSAQSSSLDPIDCIRAE